MKNFINDFYCGEKEAFEEIVIRHKKNLIYFIQGYVKNATVAEDLMQDVFVYLLINKKEYDFKYSLKTYLYTIAKSRAINYLKKEKRIVELNENLLFNENDLEEDIFKKEKYNNLKKAIKKLKSQQWQTIIYLNKIEEMSYKEICKVLNKSMPQVKITIHRATKELEKILKKEAYKYEE